MVERDEVNHTNTLEDTGQNEPSTHNNTKNMGRELACFKVELQQRDRQIETLTTQMRCLSTPANAPKAPPPSPTPTQPNFSSTPPASTKPSHPSNSQREAETPATPRNPSEKHYSYNPSWETASENRGWHCHPRGLQWEVPTRRKTVVPKNRWCPQNSFWLQLWHTLTYHHTHRHNDLRREQERVGQLICRVAEKAPETYPNTKITIYTLLPRKDIHPDTRESTLTSPKDALACPMCTWLITPPSQSETCTTMYT